MRPMGTRLTILVLLAAVLTITGCPSSEEGGGADSGFEPSAPIPAQGPLLSWADLTLGMSSFEISQVYNAPEGRGEDFTRVLKEYGSSMTQLIEFDRAEGEPERAITCALYRDQLFMLVDRREGLSAEQAEELRQQCIALFGEPVDEPVPGAQWSWGGRRRAPPGTPTTPPGKPGSKTSSRAGFQPAMPQAASAGDKHQPVGRASRLPCRKRQAQATCTNRWGGRPARHSRCRGRTPLLPDKADGGRDARPTEGLVPSAES